MSQTNQVVKVVNGEREVRGIWTTTVSDLTGGSGAFTPTEVLSFSPSAASGVVTNFTTGPQASISFYVPGAAGTAQPVLEDTITGATSGTVGTLSAITSRPTFVDDLDEGDLFTIQNTAGIRFIDSVDTQSQVKLIENFGGTTSENAIGLFTTSFSSFLNLPLPELGTLDHELVTRAALVTLDTAFANLDPEFGVGISGTPGIDGVVNSINSLSQAALTIDGLGTITVTDDGASTISISGTAHSPSLALDDLTDADTASATLNQFLVKGASDWTATTHLTSDAHHEQTNINTTASGSGVTIVGDGAITITTDGQQITVSGQTLEDLQAEDLQDAYNNSSNGHIDTAAGKPLVVSGTEGLDVFAQLTIKPNNPSTDKANLLIHSEDQEANLVIDSGETAGAASDVEFADRGSTKWVLRKNSNNDFSLVNSTGATNPFFVEDGAPTGQLYLKSDGNVGLGSVSPTQRLHVVGSGIVEGNFTVQPNNPATDQAYIVVRSDDTEANIKIDSGSVAANSSDLEFVDRGTTKWIVRKNATGNLYILNVDGGNTIPFLVENNAPTNQLYLKSDGNIGIHTSTPAAELEVVLN